MDEKDREIVRLLGESIQYLGFSLTRLAEAIDNDVRERQHITYSMESIKENKSIWRKAYDAASGKYYKLISDICTFYQRIKRGSRQGH